MGPLRREETTSLPGEECPGGEPNRLNRLETVIHSAERMAGTIPFSAGKAV